MKQYCRYCCEAVLNDGFFFCEKEYKCYPLEKAKRQNHCKDFDFNPYDLLRMDKNGNFVQYKPREHKPHEKKVKMENYSLFE